VIFTTLPRFIAELRNEKRQFICPKKNRKCQGQTHLKVGTQSQGSKAFYKRYDSLVAKNRGTACPTVLDRLFYFRLLTGDLGIWTQGFRRSLAERALYEH